MKAEGWLDGKQEPRASSFTPLALCVCSARLTSSAQKMEDIIRDLVIARVATPPPAEGTDPMMLAAHQLEFEERNLGRFYSPETFAEVSWWSKSRVALLHEFYCKRVEQVFWKHGRVCWILDQCFSSPAGAQATELSRLLHRDVEAANDDDDWDSRLATLEKLLEELPDDDQDKEEWTARCAELRRRTAFRAPEVSPVCATIWLHVSESACT